jgi:hypothetical protein
MEKASSEKKQQKPQMIEKPSRKDRFIRFMKHFAISCFILLCLEIAFGYALVATRWRLYVSNEQMARFALEIEQTEPMPENFKRVYSAIFPRHINATMTEQIFLNYVYRFAFRHATFDSKPHCYCDMVFDILRKENKELNAIRWDGRLEEIEFGFGLENFSAPQKCFDYAMRKRLEELRRLLHPELYHYLVNADIKKMSDDEIIELIILLKSRNEFNKEQRPDLFYKYLEEHKEKLRKASE